MRAEEPGRDETLRRLLAGDLDPGREPARELLARSPELARELAELRALEEGLAVVRREREAVLAEAAGAARSPEEDAIVARFRTRAGAGRSAGAVAPARTRPAPWRAALAAAVLLAVLSSVVLLLRRAENPAGGPATLGAHDGCLAPEGEVEAWGSFRWDFDLPPNGSFELSISDATAGGAGDRVLVVEDLTERSWTWDPARDPALPARIEWSVLVLDGSGVPDGRGCRARAWLR